MERTEPSRAAFVMFEDADGNDQSIERGTWDIVPWGFDRFCYRVMLDDGRSLHVNLEGVTNRADDEETVHIPRSAEARLEVGDCEMVASGQADVRVGGHPHDLGAPWLVVTLGEYSLVLERRS